MARGKERAERKLRHSSADKPQPRATLASDSDKVSETSRAPSKQIDIRELRVSLEKERKEITARLREQFPENPAFNRTFGKLVFGSETKIVGGKKEAWTTLDFVNALGNEAEEEERSSRRTLTRDLIFAFDMQSRHFGNPEDPEHGETTDVIDACATILGRILDSPEKLTEMWPLDRPEERTQAQFLEVVRRVTLNPPYFMFGLGHDGELDAFHFPGNDFNHRFDAFDRFDHFLNVMGLDRTAEAQQAFIKSNVVQYSDEDWNKILEMQEHLVMTYVKSFVGRFALGSENVFNAAPLLTEYGERVYTDEQIDLFRDKATSAKQIAAVVAQMESFSDLFPQIRKWFGEESGFKEFLDKLRPARITKRGIFEVPNRLFDLDS